MTSSLKMNAILVCAAVMVALALIMSVSAQPARYGEHSIEGAASWYGESYRGKLMANGVPFDPDAMTCASWDFPFGTRLRVLCHETGKIVVVTVTDRGPAPSLYSRGRVIDLSRAAFASIADPLVGIVTVSITTEGDQ